MLEAGGSERTAAAAETGDPDARPLADALTRDSRAGAGATPTPAALPPAAPGARLGRYTVLRLLGQGGMGVVYVAYDDLLDRPVALKLVRTDSRGGDAHARILREAKALAQLSHPNVVQIYEVSASAGRIFLAMEYIQGATLRARAEAAGRPRTRGERRALLGFYLQAGRGLAAAHAQGLVHRDFKPDNVLVGEDGRARVIDFGLATALGAAEGDDTDPGEPREDDAEAVAARLTRESALLGTPAYMSPEQLVGRPADARSDQFSFCVALYEALCGVRPFAGETLPELLRATTEGALREPQRALPGWLAAILRRGLQARPEDRFPSMDALLDRLGRDPAVRLRAAALVVGTAVAAVLVVLLGLELRAQGLQRAREEAAERSLAAAEARIAEARAEPDPAAAARIFQAFVDDPVQEGTAALASAWLAEADRREADGDREGARAALAAGYFRAQQPAQRARALTGLAAIFREQLDWEALAALLALVDRDHPEAAADLAGLQVDLALGRRDLAGARARLGDDGPAPLRALTGALAGATVTAHGGEVDAVHVAGDRLILVASEGADSRALLLADRAPGLPTRLRAPLPAGTDGVVVADGAPLAFFFDRTGTPVNTLVEIDDEGLTPLIRWDGEVPFVAAAADLDHDGAPEIYAGTGDLEILAFAPGADGRWGSRVVHSARDTLSSGAHGLCAADIDGDGDDDLVAGFPGWRAFDVRLLRLGPRGTLEIVDRDKLGAVLGAAPLRGPGGARLLAVKNTAQGASRLVFPPDRPAGEPAGIYVYDLGDGRLGARRRLPLPLPANAGFLYQWAPAAADVDGDRLGDIAVEFRAGDGHHTLFYVQGADGGWTPAVIGDLQFLAFADVDDDPAAEVIAKIPGAGEGDGQIVVLGAGDRPLGPATPRPRASDRPLGPAPAGAAAASPAVVVDDPAWARARAQAAALAAIGLHRDAAAAFAELARRAPSPAARREASFTAAELHAGVGDDRRALPLYLAAAALPADAPADAARARLGAALAQLHLGEYAAAGESLAALDAVNAGAAGDGLDAVDPGVRALARRYAPIVAAGRDAVEIDFSGPLDPAWTLEDPLALGREPGGDALLITTAAPGLLASLPLEGSGEVSELEVDLTVVEAEWMSALSFAIVAEDDPGRPILEIELATYGSSSGSVVVRRQILCAATGAPRSIHSTTDATRSHALVIRAHALPALGEAGCTLDDGGDAPVRRRLALAEAPAPGRYRLEIRASSPGPAWLDVAVRRLRLRGFRLAPPTATVDDHPALRRALVTRDPVAALAALDAIAEPTPLERLWRAHVLVQVGRVDDARAAWSAVLADPAVPAAALGSLLRARPDLHAPLLRALAPARALDLIAATWRNTAVNHLDEPRARASLLAVLRGLGPGDLDVDDPDPAARARARDLLTWRGRAHARAREPERARADLVRALALAKTLPTPGEDPWLLHLDLAVLAAEGGDLRAARDHVLAAAGASDMPLLVRDVVLARPAIAGFAAELPDR